MKNSDNGQKAAGNLTQSEEEIIFDPRQFRAALGCYPTGVAVITTVAPDGTLIGMTANSFSSVSINPPLILWSIMRAANSFDAFTAASHFAINILSEQQQDISNRFARPSDDKFVGVRFEKGLGGAPLFPHCAAQFECAMWNQYDGGDHVILIGEVKRFRRWAAQPLVFAGGRYGALVPPEAPIDCEDWPISFG